MILIPALVLLGKVSITLLLLGMILAASREIIGWHESPTLERLQNVTFAVGGGLGVFWVMCFIWFVI